MDGLVKMGAAEDTHVVVVCLLPLLLPAAHCLLLIAHCLLRIAHCLLLIAHCLLAEVKVVDESSGERHRRMRGRDSR